MFANEGGVSLMQGEALFDIRKRPLQIEKGVSLILKYYYLYSCLALLCKLIAVFTPLSIRRGDGGEAVDRRELGCRWTGERLLLSLQIGLGKAFRGVRIGFKEGYP